MDFFTAVSCLVAGFLLGMIFTLQRQRGRQKRSFNSPLHMPNTDASITRRERNVQYVIRRYAEDRILAIFETSPDVERALQVAFSLQAGFDSTEPLFPWLEPANDLLSGMPMVSRFGATPGAFTIAQFQELDRRAVALAEACDYAGGTKKREFVAWMRLSSKETPEAATLRLFNEGDKVIADLLRHELLSHQISFFTDNMEFRENDPEPDY